MSDVGHQYDFSIHPAIADESYVNMVPLYQSELYLQEWSDSVVYHVIDDDHVEIENLPQVLWKKSVGAEKHLPLEWSL